jgi:hypothetical protein
MRFGATENSSTEGPESFRLDAAQIEAAVAEVPEQAIRDTDYSQKNVRRFAEAQLTTMLPLEVNIRPGVTLGHKHIPVGAVGSYIPGGRYPMFGSAKMSYQTRDYHIDYDIFCEIYDPNRNGRLGTCMESRAAPSGGGAV